MKRGYIAYIAIVVVVGLLLFVSIASQGTQRGYSWAETMSPNDGNPFGTLVFDSVMKKTLPHGYEVRTTNALRFLESKEALKHNLIIYDSDLAGAIENNYTTPDTYYYATPDTYDEDGEEVNDTVYFDGDEETTDTINIIDSTDIAEEDIHPAYMALLNYVKRGGKLLLVGTGYMQSLYGEDTLKANRRFWHDIDWGWERNDQLDRMESNVATLDSIYNGRTLNRTLITTWKADGRYKEASYEIPYFFSSSRLYANPRKGSHWQSIVEITPSRGQSIVAVGHYGKGEIIVTTANELFTNYCILDDRYRPLTLRIMQQISDRNVVRLIASTDAKSMANNTDPLGFLLSKPPLRMAVQLALVALLLFMIFTARRQQRPIPPIKPEPNRTLEFIKRIGRREL